MPYRINAAMEDSLVSIFTGILGGTVIWTMQDAYDDLAAVKPILPFTTLNIISGPTPVDDYEMIPSESGEIEFDYERRHEFTLSVNIHENDGHLAAAARLAFMLRIDKYRDMLTLAGISLLETNNIGDISVLDETRFKLRAHIDFVFSYISKIKDVPVGVIEHVYIEGTLGNIAVSVEAHK